MTGVLTSQGEAQRDTQAQGEEGQEEMEAETEVLLPQVRNTWGREQLAEAGCTPPCSCHLDSGLLTSSRTVRESISAATYFLVTIRNSHRFLCNTLESVKQVSVINYTYILFTTGSRDPL